MSELSSSARKVQEALAAAGLACTVRELPASTRSAAEAAAAIGCRVEEIAKSLVFRGKTSGKAILAIARGTVRVDEKLLAEAAGEPIERATPELVREATGFAIGGVPPIGHGLVPFVERGLVSLEKIWAAAGTPHAVFEVGPADLVRATGARVVDLARA